MWDNIRVHIITALLTIAPLPVYAFNSIVMMDPDFHIHMAMYLPLAGGLCISIWEAVIFRRMFGKIYGIKQFFKITMLQNIWALFLYVLLTIFILSVVKDVLIDAKHPFVVWLGMGYFAIAYIYFSSSKKIKMLNSISMPEVKALSLKIYLVNTLSYMAIYGYLIVRLY